MTTDENYKQSVDLWVDGQKKNIEILELSVKQIQEEITLKNQKLQIEKKTLEHERMFLEQYLETIEK